MAPAFVVSPLAPILPRYAPSLTRARPTRVAPHRRVCVATAAAEEATDATDATDVWVPASQLSQPAAWPTVLSIEQIMQVLPHRYPFLLLDRVIAYEPGKRAIAVKNVSINEPFFPGHFPDRPIMPGVLQVEALAQVGGIVMLQQPISDGQGDFFFGGVDRVKWRKPVLPGDTLVMEMTLESYKPRFGIAKMAGKAYVDGQLVVEGIFTLVMVVEKD